MFTNLFSTIPLVHPLTANPHFPIVSSFPQNGKTIDELPTQIVTVFNSSAKLIKVNLSKSPEKKVKGLFDRVFGGGDAEQVSLGAGALMNNSERHTIPVPSLSIGAYSLSWRDMGAVGHIIKGNHSFTIVGG